MIMRHTTLGRMRDKMVSKELLDQYVKKLVDSVDPDAIVLFGSYARNQAAPESDVDLLIIYSGDKLREAQRKTYTALAGRSVAVDIIVRSALDLQARLEWPDPFVKNIFREGKVLYAKPHSLGMNLFR